MWQICSPLKADIVYEGALCRGDEGLLCSKSASFNSLPFCERHQFNVFSFAVIRPEFRTTFASTDKAIWYIWPLTELH